MRRLWLLVLMLGAVAAGCGDDGSPSGAGEDEVPEATLLEGEQVEIDAVDNSFQPDAARIAVGTEVTWRNSGRNDHNVVAEDEDAEWGLDAEDFGPGETGSYTFTEPGVYRYYCSIHGTVDAGMPGVLVVEE